MLSMFLEGLFDFVYSLRAVGMLPIILMELFRALRLCFLVRAGEMLRNLLEKFGGS